MQANASHFQRLRATIAESRRKAGTNIQIADYALVGTGSALAAWSVGQAMGSELISIFASVLVGVGTTFSFLVRRWAKESKWLRLDGVLYTLAACSTVFFAAPLNSLVPDGGFSQDVLSAGWLTWMLIFGSFLSWRDATLLFQAVPAIALFGLIGCYDTFHNAVFLFFGFLVCLSTFFSRAHSRQMMEDAINSGFLTRADGADARHTEDRATIMAEVRNGPWRWLAGPEWALGSALIVVLVSLLGAPVIQNSVAGVAGVVHIRGPKPKSTTVPKFASGFAPDEVRVSGGPIKLTDNPVLDIRMNRLRYLRANTYDMYTGAGWTRSGESQNTDNQKRLLEDDLQILQDADEYNDFSFDIQLFQSLGVIPTPPEIAMAPAGSVMTGDGAATAASVNGPNFGGQSREPISLNDVTTAKRGLRPELAQLTNGVLVPPAVRALALKVTSKSRSDMANAMAIRDEIAKDIEYSIDTPRSPEGVDPVQYALFTSHLGYCDVFASAMVLMARAAGLPARYAVGYLPDANAESDTHDLFHVQEKDAHAWAELYFEKAGWVIFDPTASAQSVPGQGVGAENSVAWYRTLWFISGCLGLVVIVLIGCTVAFVRAALYRRSHPDYRAQVENLYLEFAYLIQRTTGRRRGLGATSREYLLTAAATWGALSADAQAINRSFETAFYGPTPPDAAVVQSLKTQLEAFRSRMKEALGSRKAAANAV